MKDQSISVKKFILSHTLNSVAVSTTATTLIKILQVNDSGKLKIKDVTLLKLIDHIECCRLG